MNTISLPVAARHLGVSVRVLRHAMRTGAIPNVPHLNATTPLDEAWLNSVNAALTANPKALRFVSPNAAAPFARYPGTSAWRKYPNRVREYAAFQAAHA